jgi:hypothetical protein
MTPSSMSLAALFSIFQLFAGIKSKDLHIRTPDIVISPYYL